jgi:IS1 family transposase
MDGLWSFVYNKGNQPWVWLAIDRDTREIIGCHITDSSKATLRDRSRESAIA